MDITDRRTKVESDGIAQKQHCVLPRSVMLTRDRNVPVTQRYFSKCIDTPRITTRCSITLYKMIEDGKGRSKSDSGAPRAWQFVEYRSIVGRDSSSDKTHIPRHRHPRDDPRDDVGENVGVVECGLNAESFGDLFHGVCVNCSLLTDSHLLLRRRRAICPVADVQCHASVMRKPVIPLRTQYGSFHLDEGYAIYKLQPPRQLQRSPQ